MAPKPPYICCTVCQDVFQIERFRWLQCGHGFCEECTNRTAQLRDCPVCRTKKPAKVPPHPIFVEFVEPTEEERAVSAIMDMDCLGNSSSVAQARDACGRVKDVVDNVPLDEATKTQLLRSAEAMERRFEPLLFQLENERYEKAALQRRVSELAEKHNTLRGVSRAHFNQLEERLSVSQYDLRAADQRAREAVDHAARCVREKNAVDAQLYNARNLVEQQDVEIVRLRMELERVRGAMGDSAPRFAPSQSFGTPLAFNNANWPGPRQVAQLQ